MENMPAVVLAVILGTAFGIVIHLGDKINIGARVIQKLMDRIIKSDDINMPESEFMNMPITVIVLFCASSTRLK